MSNAHTSGGSNAMAVRTNHFALPDFTFGLSNAFGVAHVERLTGDDMVEFERDRVSLIPAIRAPSLQFVSVKPVSDAGRSLVGLLIDHLPVAWNCKPLLAPRLYLFWRKLAFWTGSLSALVGTKPCRALGIKASSTLDAGEIPRRRLGPWGHAFTVPSVAFPCKPDIFAATYEPVSDAIESMSKSEMLEGWSKDAALVS
jgi:hypothetical protein